MEAKSKADQQWKELQQDPHAAEDFLTKAEASDLILMLKGHWSHFRLGYIRVGG